MLWHRIWGAFLCKKLKAQIKLPLAVKGIYWLLLLKNPKAYGFQARVDPAISQCYPKPDFSCTGSASAMVGFKPRVDLLLVPRWLEAAAGIT